MRKLIFQMMVSLDGYFEGPAAEINWHRVDAEFNEYAIEFLNSVDMLVFGRVTYQLMADYWDTPLARANDPIVAERMNNLPKIVFSKSLPSVEWQNTRLERESVPSVITTLKQFPGEDIAVLGSSDLMLTLIRDNLIDEYRIFVNPIILGGGKTLFKGINEQLNLKLVKTKTFGSGVVALYYEPQ